MFIKKYHSIMEKDEAYRGKWALGLTITLSLFIFTGFAFYKGYITVGTSNPGVLAKEEASRQIAAAASASAPSPFESSKKTFSAAFEEITKQYAAIKESMASVFVPFVTGIDVYERGEK